MNTVSPVDPSWAMTPVAAEPRTLTGREPGPFVDLGRPRPSPSPSPHDPRASRYRVSVAGEADPPRTQSRYGTEDTTTEGSKRKVPLSVNAVWLCKNRCHHFRTTNSGITIVTKVFWLFLKDAAHEGVDRSRYLTVRGIERSKGKAPVPIPPNHRGLCRLFFVDFEMDAAQFIGAQRGRLAQTPCRGIVDSRDEYDYNMTPKVAGLDLTQPSPAAAPHPIAVRRLKRTE